MSKAKQAVKNIDAMLSSDEDEQPKKVQTKVAAKPTKATKAPVKDSDDESDSSSSVEILKNKTKRPSDADTKKAASALPKAQAKAAPKKVASDSDESSEEEVKKPVVAKKAAPKKVASDSDESSEEVVKKPVVAKKAAPKKVASDSEESSEEVVKKPATKAPAKKAESSDEDEDEEPVKVQPKATPKVEESGCSELFCKNLSWNTDENLLGEFFGKYGEVTSVKVLYDKMTGKARGLGFVAFASRADAQKALDDADNLNVDGRTIQVTFSDQKPERPQGGNNFGGNRGGYGGDRGGNRGGYGGDRGGDRGGNRDFGGEKFTAFVGNLGFKSSEQSVRKFFSDCGSVVDVRIAKNEEGRSKGFCHVDFDSNEAVEKAKAKAGQELDGREIRVDASTPRQGGGRGGGFGGRGGRGGFDRGGRGGRGGFNKPGSMRANPGAVQTFDDDE